MELNNFFFTQVLRWRYAWALCIILLIHNVVVVLACCIFQDILVNSIWSPFVLFSKIFNEFFSFLWIQRVFFPSVYILILTRIYVRTYLAPLWVPRCRWDFVSHFISPVNFGSFCTASITCCLLMHNYTGLLNPAFSSVLVPCSGIILCVNHRAVLTLIMGLFFGCCHSLKCIHQNSVWLSFPVVQSSIHDAVRAKIQWKIFSDSCSVLGVNISSVCGIIGFYLLFGEIINSHIASAFGLLSGEAWSLWHMMFDFELISVLLMSSILLSITLNFINTIFVLFLTERIKLPVCSNNGDQMKDKCAWTLGNALESQNKLLQLLAFQNLQNLSCSDPSAVYLRGQIFKISQPGGHPYNWQGIMKPSLKLIVEFTKKLQLHNFPDEQKSAPSTISAVLTTETERSFNLILSKLRQLPIYCYFFNEIADATNRQVFSESLPVVFAVHGLSGIVVASYTEDKYGIVQQNMSEIITSLMHLQQVLDRLARTNLVRRPGPLDYLPYDYQLYRALRLALRTSFYNITTTFKDTIRDIPLASDVQSKLQSYLEFKEG